MTVRLSLVRCTLFLLLLIATTGVAVGSPVTIEVVLTGQDELYQEVVRRFEASHPEIEVDYRTEQFGGWQEKLSVLLASDQAPDAFLLSWAYFEEFAQLGALLDLSPMLTRDHDSMDASDVFQAAWDAGSYQGRQLAIPFLPGHSMMFFNEEILQSTGLASPQDGWTWGDFTQSAVRTTSRSAEGGPNDRYGIDGISYWGFWSSHLFSHGGSFWNEAGDGFAVDSPEGRETFQYLQDLIHSHGVAPAPGHELGELWSSGRQTFRVGGSSVNRISSEAGLAYGVADFPAGPNGPVNSGGILVVAGNKKTEHPEAVWTFMKYLLSEEALQFRAANGQLPVRLSVVQSIEDPSLRRFAEGIASARAFTTRYYAQLVGIINTHVNQILRNEQAVPAALDRLQAELEGYLDNVSR